MAWELDKLDERQEARLAEVGAGLDAGDRVRLRELAKLHNMEAEWRAARLATVLRATHLADRGTLPIEDILKALQVSRTTWLRRRAELRATLAGSSLAGQLAAGDQAVAGAPDGDRDDEGSL